jgi:plasmid stabilization system protein ParE
MRIQVLLTADASRDLEDLYDYVAEHDAPSKADYVLDHLENVLEALATFPERGSHPKELLALGIREYRQTFFPLFNYLSSRRPSRICLFDRGWSQRHAGAPGATALRELRDKSEC